MIMNYFNNINSDIIYNKSLNLLHDTLLLALEYAIRKIKKTDLELDMNGNHKVLAYASDFGLVDDNIKTIERNEDVLNGCNGTSLEVNIRKTKYMELRCNRDMMANEHIRIGGNSYEKVKTLKYLSSLLTIKIPFKGK